MPNHCSQVVVFNGPQASIDKIKALLSSEKDNEGALDFEKIKSRPPELDITCGSTTDEGMAILKSGAVNLLGYFKSKGYTFDGTSLTGPHGRGHWLLDELVKAFKAVADDPEKITPDVVLLAPLAQMVEVALKAEIETIKHGQQAIENLKKYGVKSWYDWSVKHWGTKWNAYSGSIDADENGHLKLRFDTAWSPPKPIYVQLAEMFPDVSFTVQAIDEGWCFACVFEASDGNLTDMDVPCDRENPEFRAMYLEVYGQYPDPEEDEEEEEEMEALPAPPAALPSPESSVH